MSTPKKVLFIGLGILALGIVVLILGLQQSPTLWQVFKCGYDLGINNSSLTREQISEYCNNNQILTIEKEEEAAGLTTVGFGIILIVIGLITTGIGGIWLLLRAIRKERTEAASSLSSSEMSVEMMTTMNSRRIEEGEQDDWFTPKKVLAYCMIIGLISGTLSIFINSLIVLSIGAFVFASITLWYMFGDKFHRWKERSEKKNREEPSI
ncbi:MAG TPA: hypothetical protein VKA91_01515 [Nitrososphaeraceae archaeon]|nr:hypothetical protein [Nitrososphaeraceae archaeon]